jgi:hypothetical protein
MGAVPAAMPENIPDPEPIVATLPLPELQVPPEVASVSVAVLPVQTIPDPAIAAGNAFTVRISVSLQPVAN